MRMSALFSYGGRARSVAYACMGRLLCAESRGLALQYGFIRRVKMIIGIGVDLAQIAEIGRLAEVTGDSFLRRTFTEEEREEVQRRATKEARLEYYAARFAAKEAVFKALAPHTPEKGFDFRHVCTLNREDGSPYVKMTDWMREICAEAGVRDLHISITTEGEYAAAFVVVEG